ncbi:MAG: FAD/NAD(P)-binding oxidoreductase [Thermoplasmata archaeon]|nr:MAG: FAD/NAD(P)-binding oxidoreductase [Thermoplasmata archaeon]
MKNFHVAIIGGGVIGSAVAWELSKYKLDVVVFEKGVDVCSGNSKANSGVVHSGINSPPGSLKARFCVQGNKMFQELSEKLGFSLKWVGKYIIAKDEEETNELERLKKVGEENNVPGLEILSGREVKQKEPNVSCYRGLWVPTAGIVLPYEFTIALAENAVLNDVVFYLETKVNGLKKTKDGFLIETNKGVFQSRVVINAAGLNCRDVVSMLEKPDFNVYPCRGEYLILDKEYSSLVNSMIYPVPVKELGVLGVHITPTIEGNILLGPSAEFIDDLEATCTTRDMMKTLMEEVRVIIPDIPEEGVISAYSGIRCKLASPSEGGWADFRIEESRKNPGLINLLGIESPGLTAAPAIAKKISDMLSDFFDMSLKDDFKTKRIFDKRFSEMSLDEKSKLVKSNNRHGRIICRCEQVTEGEVIDALSNLLGAKSLSSVKYRCRAGMGRCQGGFCTQHIVRVMEKNFDMDVKEIKLKSSESNLFVGRTRETSEEG